MFVVIPASQYVQKVLCHVNVRAVVLQEILSEVRTEIQKMKEDIIKGMLNLDILFQLLIIMYCDR